MGRSPKNTPQRSLFCWQRSTKGKKKLMGSQYRIRNGHAHKSNAVVIHPVLQDADQARSPEARLEEAVGLAKAIELEVLHAASIKVNRPQPATLLGGGTVVELASTDRRGRGPGRADRLGGRRPRTVAGAAA